MTIAVLVSLTAGCGHEKKQDGSGQDILVTVGDSSLLLDNVLISIPVGLSAEDSAEMFHAIVDSWIERQALAEVAEENAIDIDRINRLVDDYRSRLIIDDYLHKMVGSRGSEPQEKEIRQYYEANKDKFILNAPLVKGIYIKTPDDDDRLPDLKRWIQTATESAVDNIEKNGLRHAVQYEYFADRWLEWNVVAEQIPYRFYDADAFLRSTRNFVTSYDGSTYLLHIFEYLPSGAEMPYEYAASKIAEILKDRNSAQYRKKLLHDIYSRQIKSGKISPGTYDPLTGKMKTGRKVAASKNTAPTIAPDAKKQ